MFTKFIGGVLLAALPFNLLNFETSEYKDMSVNPIIIDLDMSTDVDDPVAIRMGTILDDMDICSLKAVGLCTTSPTDRNLPAKAAQGILEYKGYSNVKVGYAHYQEDDESKYWDLCAAKSRPDYPYKDAVEVYKEVLKNCQNPVTIVTTGYLNNVEALLKDPEGFELVKNNCCRIVITGGTYPTGQDNNFSFTQQAATSVKYVNDNAPCDILYVANDVGGPFTAGGIIVQKDPNDPVAQALNAWGAPDGRAAWDPTAVFIAAMPKDIFNFKYEYIDSQFTEDGTHTFNQVELSNRQVVRRLDSISLNQYKQMIEGVLGAGYVL